MTLDEFKALLLAIDPKLFKYKGAETGNYTIWKPGNIAEGLESDDDREEDDQRVYVDRFTLQDNDTIAAGIKTMLRAYRIPFEYVHDYEQDTGYIHHAFTCIVG